MQQLGVGGGILHITGLHRFQVADRLATQGILQELDEANQLYWFAISNVKHSMWRPAGGRMGVGSIKVGVCGRWLVEAADHPFNDVVDVGEVAAHAAVVEHTDRLASEDRTGEQHRCHVRPAPGAIHREEA